MRGRTSTTLRLELYDAREPGFGAPLSPLRRDVRALCGSFGWTYVSQPMDPTQRLSHYHGSLHSRFQCLGCLLEDRSWWDDVGMVTGVGSKHGITHSYSNYASMIPTRRRLPLLFWITVITGISWIPKKSVLNACGRGEFIPISRPNGVNTCDQFFWIRDEFFRVY